MTDANTATCVGTGGVILRTTNAGLQWTTQPSGTINDLYGVNFINANTGTAVGIGGAILKTTNGGATIIQKINSTVPSSFKLLQNFPNPFNPVTTIRFNIANAGFVKLSVYNILGKEIETIVNESMSEGTYETKWDASSYPGGVYFYRLETDGYSETRKLVLLK